MLVVLVLQMLWSRSWVLQLRLRLQLLKLQRGHLLLLPLMHVHSLVWALLLVHEQVAPQDGLGNHA